MLNPNRKIRLYLINYVAYHCIITVEDYQYTFSKKLVGYHPLHIKQEKDAILSTSRTWMILNLSCQIKYITTAMF